MQKRVIIIGAGVIGLILGKELGKLGIDTTIYDSKSLVSSNAAKASGIFSSRGLSNIDVDYKDALVNTMTGAVLHGGGEELVVQTSETKAYILDRGIFAELIAKEAQQAGAKIILKKRITKEELVELAKDERNIIVGADGAISMVASAFDFPKINEYILTYKAEYENVKIKDIHKVELFFSNKIAKRFFGWTVPYTKTKLEVGIGISSYSKKTSTATFNEFVETKYIKELLMGSKKVAGYASIIPLEFRKKTVKGNVLLVGDAAGQVKATTGGGIIFGASCAKIAASVISKNIKNNEPLANYEKEWRKKYELDLKMHKILHSYYSGLSEKSFALVIKISKLVGFETFLAKYGDMDSPKLMVKRFFTRKIT